MPDIVINEEKLEAIKANLRTIETIEEALRVQVLCNTDQVEGTLRKLYADSRKTKDSRFVSVSGERLIKIRDSVEHLVKAPVRRQFSLLSVALRSVLNELGIVDLDQESCNTNHHN